MSSFVIEKVLALPEVLQPNTIYAVASSVPDHFDLYVTGIDASTIKRIPTQAETLLSVVALSDDPPAIPCKSPLWWDTGSGTLYVQYHDGETTTWVEAIPSIAVPDFAGSGTANTMARSDHNHDGTYFKLGEASW